MIVRVETAQMLFAALVASVSAIASGGDDFGATLSKVGFDQRLGQTISLDLKFVDQTGRQAPLGEFCGSKPVILALVYYQCPMLCNETLNGLLKSTRTLSLKAGVDYEVVAVSIDPREGSEIAAAKMSSYSKGPKKDAAAWHWLTGQAEAIAQLSQEAGFRYVYDDRTQQYVHSSGIMLITPEGAISRYMFGNEYPPRDLQLGLIEASGGKIGSLTDQIILYCYRYDPATGKYGFVIMNVVRAISILTVVGLATAIGLMLRSERRKSREIAGTSTAAGLKG